MSGNARIDDELSLPERIRKLPGMYVGDKERVGLHVLLWGALDNSVNEALAGYGGRIEVVLGADGSCAVKDEGRGIGSGSAADEALRAIDVAMTRFGERTKETSSNYRRTGGMHTCAMPVVNALSSEMRTRVSRDGSVFEVRFERGATIERFERERDGDGPATGTEQWFRPDPEVFKTLEFDEDVLRWRLRELAFLHRSLRFELRDERHRPERISNYCYDRGVADFLEYLVRFELVRSPAIVARGERDGIAVEVAYQWTHAEGDMILAYANGTDMYNGGTHRVGFESAIATALNGFAATRMLFGRAAAGMSVGDCVDGLTAVLSVNLLEPIFLSSTRRKLGNKDAGQFVNTVVRESLDAFLEANPEMARALAGHALNVRSHRLRKRRGRMRLHRYPDRGVPLAFHGWCGRYQF